MESRGAAPKWKGCRKPSADSVLIDEDLLEEKSMKRHPAAQWISTGFVALIMTSSGALASEQGCF